MPNVGGFMKKFFYLLVIFYFISGYSEICKAENNLVMKPKLSSSKKNNTLPGGKYQWMTQGVTPLNPDCIIDASYRFNVPVAIILTILDVEKGIVGMWSGNDNRTGDMGPMQVNSCHLEILTKKFGITKEELQTNGCLNIQVGTWLIRKHLNETNNDMMEALGRYHSRTEFYKKRYQGYVLRSYASLKSNPTGHIEKVLKKSNEIFFKDIPTR